MLVTHSRHRKPENGRRYFKPSLGAIAELANLPGPRRQQTLSAGDVVGFLLP